MQKIFYILFLILIGFFINPGKIYACGSNSKKTEKSCCKKHFSVKDSTKLCCKKNIKDSRDEDCEGTCKILNCKCTSFQYTFYSPFLVELNSEFLFEEIKKAKSFYCDIELSSGYFSVWTPPKIG